MTDGSSPSDVGTMREIEERLRARLAELEAQNRSLQRRFGLLGAGLFMIVLLLAIVAVGPALLGGGLGSDVLEARVVRIVDEDGRSRGEWGIDEEGSVRLSLQDPQGQPRLNLTVLESGYPGMALVNDAGQRRAVLGLLPDQTTTLVFADAKGIPRAVLGLTRADAANLVFADSEGVSRMGMGLDGSGFGSVIMPPDSAMVGAETAATSDPGGD